MKYGKMIGVGNTATVYEWQAGKVLKLFNQGFSKEAIEKEFYLTKAINPMGFSKPNAYEIVHCEEQMGILYDQVEGECLLDWVIQTGDLQGCAEHMAALHKTILQNEISHVPSYKEFLEWNIVHATSVDLIKQKEALQMLGKLRNGNTLCHGDFHPGNIFISESHTTVIDFMNVCRGDFLYDVARTVFLVQYTPVPIEAENRAMVLQFKKTLADLYLLQMNVDRAMIQDYLAVIAVARAGECPHEQPN